METKPTDTQDNKPTVNLTWDNLRDEINDYWELPPETKVYGVPRGGTYIAMLLHVMGKAVMVQHAHECNVIVDDIIDSGATEKKWMKMYPDKKFWGCTKADGHWLVFPWEHEGKDGDAMSTITRYLQHIGEDPTREGLLDTPKRVVKSWKELYSGYNQKAKDVLGTVFSSDNTSLVICKDIEFYSMCEHHMLPFFGKVHIGYIPNGKVVGLSKLARLVDVYARRLQIQEQLTDQVANAITEHIDGCESAMVVIEAKHHCMCARGVGKQNSSMITSALRGAFKQPDLRQEFNALIK
jgi:GTP cyclohydrolase I